MYHFLLNYTRYSPKILPLHPVIAHIRIKTHVFSLSPIYKYYVFPLSVANFNKDILNLNLNSVGILVVSHIHAQLSHCSAVCSEDASSAFLASSPLGCKYLRHLFDLPKCARYGYSTFAQALE